MRPLAPNNPLAAPGLTNRSSTIAHRGDQAACFSVSTAIVTERSEAASAGRVCNSSLARTGLAFHRINFVSCQHWLLHRGEARSVAGRAGMLLDLRLHDGPFG